jgi:hypothetical protein
MIRALRVIAILVLVASGEPADADQIDFSVDFGGLAYADNIQIDIRHFVRIAGTVTYDTAAHTVTASDLSLFHENDNPIQLPLLPVSIGENQFWHWQATETELRFLIEDPHAQTLGFSWGVTPGPTIEDFFGFSAWTQGQFDSPGNSMVITYSNWTRLYPGRDDYDVESAWIPIGSNGFLFGIVAPEPSTLALAGLGALGLLIVARRKRIA